MKVYVVGKAIQVYQEVSQSPAGRYRDDISIKEIQVAFPAEDKMPVHLTEKCANDHIWHMQKRKANKLYYNDGQNYKINNAYTLFAVEVSDLTDLKNGLSASIILRTSAVRLHGTNYDLLTKNQKKYDASFQDAVDDEKSDVYQSMLKPFVKVYLKSIRRNHRVEANLIVTALKEKLPLENIRSLLIRQYEELNCKDKIRRNEYHALLVSAILYVDTQIKVASALSARARQGNGVIAGSEVNNIEDVVVLYAAIAAVQ